ncbi:MAG: nitric oxide reductase transcriptional regulator NorR [Moraxellaceae bacterium]|nr:nitric oxide reductase transcriptional regulator NorR [Moraxellaceae bacterium]
MLENLLLPDLVADLPQRMRLQRLVATLRGHFGCGAVALLRLEDAGHDPVLRPLAVDGLVREALGRRFVVSQHPRLAAILAARGITRFEHDSPLPDPYDGLVETLGHEALPVHDCVGVRLEIEGRSWGVLTLDALQPGTFGPDALEALQRGTTAVAASVRVSLLEQELQALRLARVSAPASDDAPTRLDDEIIGHSEAIAGLLNELDVVADSGLPVLLLGETGVGKELFAHRLHRQSRRRDKPLVHVNCAALPESLAESELFGHTRGAFSGATTDRTGRIEAAEGGTLFLDEVGELPLSVQAKLLRTLQNGEVQRLGADRPRHVDVRIVAATNRQLRELVREGSFRADLFHRLSVYPVPIPPLRERGNDVLLLAGRFLELNRARLGLRSLRLSPDAQDALRRYAWPGNVRELEHVISRAALKAISRGASREQIVTLEAGLLDLDDARLLSTPSPGFGDDTSMQPPTTDATGITHTAGTTLREAVDACQRTAIQRALAGHGGNWAQAARALGVDASNLHKLARRLELKPHSGR